MDAQISEWFGCNPTAPTQFQYSRDFLKTSDWIKRDCIWCWSIPAHIGSNDDRKAVCKIITGSYHQDKWFGSSASCLCVCCRCRGFGFVCCVYFPKTNRAEIGPSFARTPQARARAQTTARTGNHRSRHSRSAHDLFTPNARLAIRTPVQLITSLHYQFTPANKHPPPYTGAHTRTPAHIFDIRHRVAHCEQCAQTAIKKTEHI